jgi:methionyl-tRNA formyltransferase
VRILFFGLPLAAVLLRADGHRIVHAFLARPGYPGERRLRRALGAAVEGRVNLDDPPVLERVLTLDADALVSWYWTTRFPPSLVQRFAGRSVGIHPSLLPRHRGPDPFFWTIAEGDAVTGVTAHALAEDYDTGAIYGQRTLHVQPTWNAWALAKALDRPSLQLLREVVRQMAAGAMPPERAQNDDDATQAPPPTDDDVEIDWTKSADRIEQLVRAASPYPGAFAALGDRTVVVTHVRVDAHAPRALEPGEAWIVSRDGGGAPTAAAVKAGSGSIHLLGGVLEDESPPRVLDSAAIARLVEGS